MSPNEFKTRLAELKKQISDLKSEYYGTNSPTLRGGGYVSISLICNSNELENLYKSGYLDNFVGVANYNNYGSGWNANGRTFTLLLVQENYQNKSLSYSNKFNSDKGNSVSTSFNLVVIPNVDARLKNIPYSSTGGSYSYERKMFRPVFNVL